MSHALASILFIKGCDSNFPLSQLTLTLYCEVLSPPLPQKKNTYNITLLVLNGLYPFEGQLIPVCSVQWVLQHNQEMVAPYEIGDPVRSFVRVPGSGSDKTAKSKCCDLSRVSSAAATVPVRPTLPNATPTRILLVPTKQDDVASWNGGAGRPTP